MEKAISIPSITVDPKVMFYEDEQPDEFKAYNEQRVVVKNTWKDILNNENDIFQGAEFPVPGNNGQTIILSPSVREGIDWQLSFIDKDGVPAMHEDYYRNDSDNPNRSKLNNEDALISRLTDYSLYNREITVRVLYEGEQIMAEKNIQNVAEEEKIIVEFQSASISNYEGYVALAQYDRENLNSDAEHNVFLGKSENYNHNYEGRGKYDNTDNSLVFISNNKKMFSFLYSSGWVFGQQKLIDKGVFTEEDYAEFANLKETVLKQFNETREIKFEIDVSKKNSGVSFSYPDWEGKESERKRRLFVDMDGTLARFHDEVQYLERMWEKDFFANLRPFENVVEGVREFIKENPDVEVFALSSVIDSEYCVDEKNQWLDKYLPEIPLKNRMFPKAGSSKSEFVKEVTGIEVTVDDFLLDDYTVNLVDWQPPGRGIKLLNAINHTKGSWQNDKIRFDRDPSDFAKGLATVMVDNEHIYDERVEQPVEIPTKWENDEPLVDIYNLEYDGEGYLHFAVDAEGYVLEGLFRLHDPANGNDMELVSIDYGDRHPIIEKQWDRIEHALVEASMERYKEMIFPCKVGQVVYGFEYPRTDITVVAEETVESLEVTEDGFFIETNGADYVLEDFGKRVFLSREEAQAVLDAREANDTHREDITLKDDVITYVAIESTEDYTDPTFHQSLIDDDIQNPDGSYGKVVNKYRLVVIGSEGRIIPLDNRVFDSFNEVSVALLTTSNYRMVNYDDMVKEAENIHIAVTHYSLDEISSELNKRDDIWIIPEDAVGIASYSFDVLSRAERILINRDPEMVQRYALVDKLNEDAEKTYGFAALSDEAVSQSYKFARDKSIPFAELESRVKDVFLYDGMSEEEIAEAKAAEKDYSAIVKYDDVLKVNDAVLLCNMFVDTDENNEGNYLYGNLRFDGQYYGILYRIENEKEGEPMKLVEIAEIPELNEPPVGQETTLKIEEMLTSYLAGEYKEPIYKSLKEAMEAGANLAEKQFVADLAKYDYIHTLYGDTCLGYAYDTNNYPNRAESPVKEIYDNVNDEVQVEVIQDAKTENPYRLVILTAGRFGERDSEHDIIYNQPMSDELLKLYNRENKTPFLETVYAMCGNAGEQPFNYYGHTLSTDDTVVVMTPDGADCHYVARFGFEAEPDVDKAISPEQRKMARLGMTVKEEFELLDRMYSFGDKKTNDQIIDRLNVLTMEYLYPINLAPVREILRNEQDKLRVINNWERQSDIFDKITFEYNEGKFTVEGGAIRECMPQQNFSNGYEYGVSKIIAGENLQNEIDRRYEAAEKRKLLEEVRVDLEFRNIAMSDENIEENINEYFAHHRSRNADDIADFIENSIAEEKSYELFARESAAINALADRLTDFIFESEYAEIPNYFSEIIDVESRASAKADIINLIESGYTEELYNALDNVMEEWSDTLREDVSLEGGNILTALESYDNMIAAYKAENEMKEKESELEGRSVEVNGWFDNFAQNFVRNEMNQENQDNRNTLNQEAYAALAKRIEEFSYDNDYFNYSDVVGIEPENREAQTADIEGYLVNRTEDLQYIADFIRENRDEYQRADEGIGNYSVEIREANDLLYSLEHLDQYLDFYHRNAPANARIPVNEFYNLDGRILEGERIPLEKSGVPHFADRSIVYNAVMKFEEDNNIPVNQREIAPDGTYTDKEFLYMAYDRYVGMSHQNDLSIQAYKPHMDAILADHSVEANNLLLIAEIYYAQRNGLSYEQIDYALTAAKEAFPVATMRNIRHGFEQGLSVEQLDVILGEDSLAQEHLIEFMIDGGSIENAKALKGADVAAYYTLKDHLNNGTISPENARAIVKTINFLKEANRADYASKYIEMEAGKAKPRFSMVDFDYMTEALVAAVAESPTVLPEQIDTIGFEFWNQNETDNIRTFIDSQFSNETPQQVVPERREDVESLANRLVSFVEESYARDYYSDLLDSGNDTLASLYSLGLLDKHEEKDVVIENVYNALVERGEFYQAIVDALNDIKDNYDGENLETVKEDADELLYYIEKSDKIYVSDITNIKCTDHDYDDSGRISSYKFKCEIKGEKDILTFNLYRQLDEVAYVINGEKNDVSGKMPSEEFFKLADILNEEGKFFDYVTELNSIESLDGVSFFREGIWDDKQLFNFVLGEEKENQLFDLINVKEEQLRAKELLKAADALPVPTIENPSKGIAFDVETTGFSKHNDEILQLSILDLDGNVLFNSYVKPYWKTEWTSAMEVNGITPEMVENAPYPHEILPQIKGIVNSANVLVGYNNPFDMGFLEQWGINFEGKQVYDVMREFAPVYGVWREDKGEYKNQKLGVAAEFFGFEFKAHDSLEDTKATLHCYKQLTSPEKSWAEAQLEIIQATNPAPNETLAWIRNIYDIHDFVGGIKWGMDNNGYEKGTDFTPDYTAEMMQKAMETGIITVYSSHPIEQGVFVTPSRMEAEGYAGDGVVYEKTVRTSEVAWIDEGQGQYANVLEWVQTKAELANQSKDSIELDEYYKELFVDFHSELPREEAVKLFEAQKAENQAMFKYATTRFLQENGITVSDEIYNEAYNGYVTKLGNAENPEKFANYIENTYFLENPIGEKDWFINYSARQTAASIYFNPDANAGGQFVISSLPYDFILKTKEETETTEEFFEYLNDYAHTDLIDIDTSEFKDVVMEYKDRNPDFLDRTEETMNGLVQAAQQERDFSLATAHFRNEAKEYIYSDIVRNHADELIYCHQNNKSFDEFNEWITYRDILGENISFEDYKGFDAHWDVDIYEYVADPTPQAIADAKAWFERYKNEKTQGKENRMISDEVILKIANGIGNTIKSVDDYNIRDYALNGGATDEEVAEITNAIRSASLGEDNFSVSETTLLKLANGIGNSIASVNDLDIVRFAEIGGASNEEISLIQKAIEIAIDGEIENSDTHREDNGVYKNNITTVKTNIGEIPIEDYREIVAGQYGYNSYEEMYNAGLRLGDEYDKKPERSDNMAKVQEKESQASVALPEEKKDAKELLNEQLQEGIKNVLNSEKFKSWLDTSNKLFLNNYSFNNAILVWLQNPDATYTMGYEQWKDYGRSVAKGAKGIKIFVPVIAYEKTEGALWNMIKNSLQKQLSNNPSLQQATYRIGMSKLEVTANRNGVYGLVIDGKERGLKTEKEMKDFIKHSVLNKVPMYFTVGTVFNHADTIIPEYLWVKKGFTKDELVRDENGKAIKNKRGEYKIINTPERQAKFNPSLDLSVPQIDEQKAAVLYDALKAVSERNGIHVYEKNREEDETLKGGADGYFSRDFSSENPKGYIVIPTDLDPTRKISVMLHEMGHSDMHGDLKKLAEKMGENYIPSQMREIQAESVAYLVGKNFGLSTETSSFQYLAAYTQGFELQALSKSIEIIYNECKQLTNELKTELEVRGLNMDLSERDTTPIDKDAIKTLTKAYMSYAVEQDNRVADIEKELPDLAKQNAGKKNVLSVVVAQNLNVQRQSEDIVLIKDAVAELKTAETLESQQDCISRIEAAKERLESYKKDFADLTVQFQEATRDNENLKSRFVDKPEATIEAMKQDYPLLQELNSAQVQYLAKSEYVKTEISPLLRNDPQKFVDKACERALQMDKVASKNGMFVEVSFCEQWTDKPIVSDGALMHPKVADTIIKQAESQIRGLKAQAQSVGDYFPYNKCDLMVFKAEDGQIATAFKTCVDIGDGSQMGLADHLKQVSNVKFAAEFEKAASEKGAKDKILFNEAAKVNVQEKPAREARPSDKGMSDKEWAQQINEAKEAMKEEKESQREEKARSKKNKNDMEH